MTMNFPTVNVSNSFLDRANENLTQLSTSCQPTSPAVADSSHMISSTLSRQQPMSSSSVLDDHNSLPTYQSQFPPLNVNGFGGGVGIMSSSASNSTSHLSYGNALSNGDVNNHTASSSPFGSSSYLNGGGAAGGTNADSGDAQMPLSLMETTQILTIPVEERCYVESNDSNIREQRAICKRAQDECNVKVELTPHRDKSLSIMINGRNDQVLKARKLLLSQLQKQASDTISIPKESHGAIIGKGATRVREIEGQTATKIHFPPQNSQEENISIVGTREGIAHAKHRLEVIAAEIAKMAYERIDVPKMYHPFICGPYNKQIERWQGEQACKVNVPPVSVDSDEIVLSGNKDGVNFVRAEIYRLVNDIGNMGKLEVQVDKAKHKYIIGQRGKGIQEILEKYHVSVEVPNLDSSCSNITLRGRLQNLGGAVSEVYDRAESYKIEKIRCPNWLHRYLIGKDGSKLQEIVGDNISKVHVEFTGDYIIVDGQIDAMMMVCGRLQSEVEMLETQKAFLELTVDSRYHKHVVGKNGANIRQLCQGKQVQIKVPNEMEDSNIIRVEGNKAEMESVVEQLKKLIHRVENEKSEDVKIEHRLHRMLIGQNGDNIKKLRDAYPDVLINFPENKSGAGVVGRSELVNVRGPQDQVDKCVQQLKRTAKDLAENNYELCVHVCRKYHKNIIGREGATINQIRRDTNTRIEMPPMPSGGGANNSAAGDDADVIKIVGRRENVERAKKRILEIENQQANIVEKSMDIPFKQHKALIGKAGAHIKSIVQECGGDATVHFPQDGGSTVTIRGDRKDVDKVIKRLKEEANRICEETEDLKVRQDLHRFLIGREGTYVRKIQEESGCTILFENNSDVITLAGSKETIAKAKDIITKRVHELESVVEDTIDIDPKIHRYFMQNSRRVLNQVIEECGGVQISFPPLSASSGGGNSNNQFQQNNLAQSSAVRIKGPTDYVKMAKEKLSSVVEDLKNQKWMYVDVLSQHHRTILGRSGSNIQHIEAELNVKIKFPDQGRSNGDSPSHNASLSAMVMAGKPAPPPQQQNQVLILGRIENVDMAAERLLALVPIEEFVHVPQRFHSMLIGSGGGHLREMQQKHKVGISVPRARMSGGAITNGDECNNPCDQVIVSGTPENVRSAKEDLEAIVSELVAKNYRTELVVNPKFFYKIIGPRGANITKMKERYEVEIYLPRQGAPEDEPIAIMGYQEKADKCKAEICKIVSQLESFQTVEVEIDTRVHARLIGAKGKNLKRISDQYKVEIKFPGRNSSEPSKVTITGMPESVEECSDKLLCLTEEYLLEIDNNVEKEYMHPSSQNRQNGTTHTPPGEASQGFVVRDAPWDPQNTSDFPSLDDHLRNRGAPAWPVRNS